MPFLFTNVPLDETIQLLANRAFTNNYFNTAYDLNLTKTDLVDLLSVAAKGKNGRNLPLTSVIKLIIIAEIPWQPKMMEVMNRQG